MDMMQPIILHNPVWQRNIESLRTYDPELGRVLSQTPLDTQQYTYGHDRQGNPILFFLHSNGQWVRWDNVDHAVHDAENWALQLPGINLQNGHIMIVGIGTGYHAQTLFKASGEASFLWFVEPEVSALKAAFHLLDFRPLIESGRVRFLAGQSPAQVAQTPFDGQTGNRMRAQGIRLQYPPVSYTIHRGFIQRLQTAIQQTAQTEAIKLNTMETQGRYVLQNSVANLKAILEGAPVSRLFHSAAAYPAVVVGPGPSLTDHLPLLRAYHERILIITIDTAWRILQRAEIPSDLVVSVDFSDLNARHFAGLKRQKESLVASPAVHPSIPPTFQGQTFFFQHHATRFVSCLLADCPLGTLDVLGSTAHAAYSLARSMGCSPILLTGIDLSFPNDVHYTPGTVQDELALVDTRKENRFPVPSNDGTTVMTNPPFKSFRDAMGVLIQKTRGRVINTSPHGAAIPFTDYGDMETTLNRVCTKPFSKSFLPRLLSPSLVQSKEAVQKRIHCIQDSLPAFLEKVENMQQRLEALQGSDAAFAQEIKHLVSAFQALPDTSSLLVELCSPLCPSTPILLFGNPWQFTSASSEQAEENEGIKSKLMIAFRGFHQALLQNQEALQQAAHNLS